jgi:transposase
VHDSQRQARRVRRKRTRFKKDFMASVSTHLRRLKFIDESGVHLGMTRTHGRARPGQRVVEATPGHSGAHYTTIATLGWHGIQAPWIWEGAMNAETFEAYITTHLGPGLRRGDIVVADNLSAHKCTGARTYLEARGIQLVFLPPYSPDFNPIELCWAKVKTALRAAKARTWEALVEALAKALRSVRPDDVKAWFAHCGYALP